MRLFVLVVVLVPTYCLTACSWHQAYEAALGWQRNACIKIMETQERERCMASTSMSYDEYKRQVKTANGAK